MKPLSLLTLSLATVLPLSSQTVPQNYSIDLNVPLKSVKRGHLDLGGAGSDGGTIAVNSYYLERNGKPFIPVIGEFHYSRYPVEYWEESLRKMKAGGIDVVGTYVFWNVHERQEGVFDWSDNLDLRRFLNVAKKVGVEVIVRMGPFCHGEIRNGGLPDWTFGKPFEIRSNDPGYLECVDRLYGEIARQLKGFLYKEGGPVVGVQLENEMQHSSAPWEINYEGAPLHWATATRDLKVTHAGVSTSTVENDHAEYGRAHMTNLKTIAKKHGIDVPLFTATGWGNAAIVPNGSLPVTAGYPYPFWTPAPKPSPFYLFKDIHKFPDYSPVSFEATDYPSIPAELGPGIAPNYKRRPYVPEESVLPMIVRVIGSGSNGVGYYMYHGGTNPVFGGVLYNEQATGQALMRYEFQSPLGPFGRVHRHFHELSLIHRFLKAYGPQLAPLPSILPPTNAKIESSDTKTLRFAARAANGSGFLFLLNFQDHATVEDLSNLQLKVADGRRTISVPSTGAFTLKAGSSAILPINLDVGGVNLRSATVQPLTVLKSGGQEHHIFFSIDGLAPELVFDSGEVQARHGCEVDRRDGATVVRGPLHQSFSFTIEGRPVLVIPRELAQFAAEGPGGRLLFGAGLITPAEGQTRLTLTGADKVTVHAYPALTAMPVSSSAQIEGIPSALPVMSAFQVKFKPVHYSATLKQLSGHKYAVHFDQPLTGLADVHLEIDYLGDTGMAFIDGKMIDDHLFLGRPWDIGLKRFREALAKNDMVLVFKEMPRAAAYLRDDIPANLQPTFGADQKSYLEVRGLRFIPEYQAALTFP
jgi:beta-galactosidase